MASELCHYCKEAPGDTIDHIVPRSLNGRDEAFNKVPSCGPCNAEKADNYPDCDCNRCRRSRRIHATKYGIRLKSRS